jgi:enoyl-CoA hydratase
MNTKDLIFNREGTLGHTTLNRPRTLNALTYEMCAAMRDQLREWERDPAIRVVVIDAVPGRAFAAGGDVRAVYDAGKKHDGSVLKFFATEYRLNAAIRHFPKPHVALIDGIAMGGGVGVSLHGSHRVVSENAVLAMPETAIGLFPDVGASYFLNRLPGELGLYLALTGERIGPADAIYSGLATDFVPAGRLSGIVPRLAQGETPDAVLSDLRQRPAAPAPLAAHRAAIDRTFAADSVEGILAALKNEGQWGKETADLLMSRSPTSLKLTFRQMREGAKLDFNSCMQMEFRMVACAMEGHDFYEGVRAALIDKDQKPRWLPSNLQDVSEQDIARYFAPFEGELSL